MTASRDATLTAGQKVKDHLEKHSDERHEAGEILKCVFTDLEKIIVKIREQNKDIPEYYIVTQTDKIPSLGNAMHIRTWWRRSRPDPRPKLDCYRVTNPGDEMEVCWSIPFKENCIAICKNPKAYHPMLAKWVTDFIKGTLV